MHTTNLKIRASFDGVVLSLPTTITSMILLYWIFPKYSLGTTFFLASPLPLLGAYRQLKYLEGETAAYQRQLETKKYESYEYYGFGNGFLSFFFYLVNIFGMFIIFIFFADLLSKVNIFKHLNFLEFFSALMFFVTFILVFIFVVYHTANLQNKNYTGYTITKIQLSEFEILGSGSKKFRFSIETMIYGDMCTSKNRAIINANIASKLPELQNYLLQERISVEKQREEAATRINEEHIKIEKEFENDPYKELKRSLTDLQI